MKSKMKRCILHIITVILSQVLFLYVLIFQYDNFVFAPRIRHLTYEEYIWVIENYELITSTKAVLCYGLRNLLLCASLIGIFHLELQKNTFLNIRRLPRILVPAIGLLFNMLCYLYLANEVEHVRMFVEFITTETLSLILGGLVLSGKYPTQANG